MQSHEGGSVTLSQSAYDFEIIEMWRYYRHTTGYQPELLTRQQRVFPGSGHALLSAEAVVASTYNMGLEASLGIDFSEDGLTLTFTPRMGSGYSNLWLLMGYVHK